MLRLFSFHSWNEQQFPQQCPLRKIQTPRILGRVGPDVTYGPEDVVWQITLSSFLTGWMGSKAGYSLQKDEGNQGQGVR